MQASAARAAAAQFPAAPSHAAVRSPYVVGSPPCHRRLVATQRRLPLRCLLPCCRRPPEVPPACCRGAPAVLRDVTVSPCRVVPSAARHPAAATPTALGAFDGAGPAPVRPRGTESCGLSCARGPLVRRRAASRGRRRCGESSGQPTASQTVTRVGQGPCAEHEGVWVAAVPPVCRAPARSPPGRPAPPCCHPSGCPPRDGVDSADGRRSSRVAAGDPRDLTRKRRLPVAGPPPPPALGRGRHTVYMHVEAPGGRADSAYVGEAAPVRGRLGRPAGV